MEEITVEQGCLRGKHVHSEESGRCFFSFQGIPYAAPPVGPLRFKEPKPALPWTGVRDATVHGNICPQMAKYTYGFQGDEDCLFLNVYTPQLPTPNAPLLPVMFRIHGGGFTMGSGNTDMYGPDFFVAENIVVVTINYRIGVLGFLSLQESEDCVGNAGLKDQVAALRWVRRNISQFGGDPEQITIAGESAGSASVDYHMLSPMSQGLFQKAIMESGTVFQPWAFVGDPRKKAFELGAILGYVTSDSRKLVAFLRTKTCEELVEGSAKIRLSERELVTRPYPFAPCLEKLGGAEEPFLLRRPKLSIQEGAFSDVPILAGVNSHEGIFMLAPILSKLDRALQKRDQNLTAILPEDLITGQPEIDEKITQEVRQFYFKGESISENNLDKYTDLLGDIMFLINLNLYMKVRLSKSKAPVYMFQFCYDGRYTFFKNMFLPDAKGASHADELFYLFCTPLLAGESDLPPSAPERLVRKRMVKMWSNFVKTGKPVDQTSELLPVEWAPASTKKMNYLNISENLELSTDMARDRVAFWEGLYQRYSKLQRSKL